MARVLVTKLIVECSLASNAQQSAPLASTVPIVECSISQRSIIVCSISQHYNTTNEAYQLIICKILVGVTIHIATAEQQLHYESKQFPNSTHWQMTLQLCICGYVVRGYVQSVNHKLTYQACHPLASMIYINFIYAQLWSVVCFYYRMITYKQYLEIIASCPQV